MDDEQIRDRINELADEEARLYSEAGPHGLETPQVERIRDIERELEQSYDLLSQRRARRAAGQDPDDAEPRKADTIERYRQ